MRPLTYRWTDADGAHELRLDEPDAVPSDGTPYVGERSERRLRGGSHQNWDLHCTVWWRYGIARDFHDGCIGFRLVLAAPAAAAPPPPPPEPPGDIT